MTNVQSFHQHCEQRQRIYTSAAFNRGSIFSAWSERRDSVSALVTCAQQPEDVDQPQAHKT
eukprot:6477245-Amphidinium_carterae.2